MYAFVSGLLLIATLVVAPGVGGVLLGSRTPVPVASGTPGSAAPNDSPVSRDLTPGRKLSSSAIASPRELAVDLVDRYESALVAGGWTTAFDLLAAASLTHEAGLDVFASERAAFFESVDGRYTVGDPVRIRDWTSLEPLVVGAVRARAWLIEVDYPALSGNNAGYEQFVVAPDPSGAWRLWPVR
jgi:hypothetical protein